MVRCLLLLIFLFSPILKAETWVVATLEWPPYTCEKCPNQGAAIKALKEVMKSVDVEMEFEFLPWSRALMEAKNAKYVGVFPVYQETVARPYTLSPLLFTSPLGFIESANKKILVTKLEDLIGKTVGIVQDYGNLKAFNELVNEGKIKTQVVIRDDLNIKKISANRIDAAIIDINSAKYYLANEYKELSQNIFISPFIVERKELFLSINSHDTVTKLKKIKAALKKKHFQKIVDEWLNRFASQQK